MNQAVMEPLAAAAQRGEHDVAVAIITPVGLYPDEDDFRRAARKTIIDEVLKLAAEKLKITNTADWVAKVDGHKIDTGTSFKDNDLKGIVEIEWHKKEGGGGA
jgi:hypothetical protein